MHEKSVRKSAKKMGLALKKVLKSLRFFQLEMIA